MRRMFYSVLGEYKGKKCYFIFTNYVLAKKEMSNKNSVIENLKRHHDMHATKLNGMINDNNRDYLVMIME